MDVYFSRGTSFTFFAVVAGLLLTACGSTADAAPVDSPRPPVGPAGPSGIMAPSTTVGASIQSWTTLGAFESEPSSVWVRAVLENDTTGPLTLDEAPTLTDQQDRTYVGFWCSNGCIHYSGRVPRIQLVMNPGQRITTEFLFPVGFTVTNGSLLLGATQAALAGHVT